MDFARKQLEKYGWKEGSGLGRNEDGIAEPLRPRLKRSSAGVGHDAAAEFNDHWWSSLYDKAAANVEVHDKTKITTKEDDAFQISSTTWQIKKKPSKSARYMDGFVKTAILTSGGARTERVREGESEDEEEVVTRLTDEELFAACGGRTAHKGARHGLRATGKLARIEEQEKNLLKLPQYKEYSHNKTDLGEEEVRRIKEVAQENVSFDEDINGKSKKKKKKCKTSVAFEEFKSNDSEEIKNDNEIEKLNADLHEYCARNKEENIVNEETEKLKTKKKKKNKEVTSELPETNENRIAENKAKKNKRRKEITDEYHLEDLAGNIGSVDEPKRKKSKKKKIKEHSEIEDI